MFGKEPYVLRCRSVISTDGLSLQGASSSCHCVGKQVMTISCQVSGALNEMEFSVAIYHVIQPFLFLFLELLSCRYVLKRCQGPSVLWRILIKPASHEQQLRVTPPQMLSSHNVRWIAQSDTSPSPMSGRDHFKAGARPCRLLQA